MTARQFGTGLAGVLAALLLVTICVRRGDGQEAPVLPEGDQGLAAKHPGDVGLEQDPAVIFVERFEEASLDALHRRWDDHSPPETMAFSDDAAPGSADKHSLLITHTGGQGTGGQIYRRLPPGEKLVFARTYVKFDPDCAKIHHFGTGLGGYNPSTRWPQGGAGELPRGDARFTTQVEPNGDEWHWDFYSYWQGMHVHGDGRYWGTPFLSGVPTPPVERGKWICVELMVKANDPPDASNGEQAFWIDGKLWRVDGQVVSHVGPGFPEGRWTGGWWHPDAASPTGFDGFRWRSVEELAVNFVWTYVYITDAPAGHVSRVWFDNVVIARSYIGPLVP
ncbi:MAG: hypothetical protein HYU66_00025 [Armatimonadetes bacterium]|nr:hypothetical protein [Armatimonadota bacterium]